MQKVSILTASWGKSAGWALLISKPCDWWDFQAAHHASCIPSPQELNFFCCCAVQWGILVPSPGIKPPPSTVLNTGPCLILSCLDTCDYLRPLHCSPPASSALVFSRQEYWSGLPFPPPGDLPDPGIEPVFPALPSDSLSLSHWGSSLNTGPTIGHPELQGVEGHSLIDLFPDVPTTTVGEGIAVLKGHSLSLVLKDLECFSAFLQLPVLNLFWRLSNVKLSTSWIPYLYRPLSPHPTSPIVLAC